MGEVTEFFTKLLSPDGWPPRWHCGHWTDFHGWLYILADLAIWAAYFTIPLSIVFFLSKKRVPFPKVLFLFASFILACGLTHLLDVVMFWYPAYRINALARVGAAIVSWRTIIVLWKVMPQAITMKSAEDFQIELTSRKAVEEKLLETNSLLAITNLELERSNAELQQFAAIASHDLKEPLRKIRTFVELLEFETKDHLNDESNAYILKIKNASTRMSTLIEDLLAFSNIGGNEESFEKVDLNVVVAKVLEDLEVLVKDKKAEIQMGNLPSIQAIPTLVTQLFQNLISNALKFTTSSRIPSIKISSIEIAGSEIALKGLNPLKMYFKITVEDNGIGFDEKFLDKIFTIFQRLHGKNEFTGTGIGLATCKKISEFHGGAISANSELGKGSTFIVILPKPN
jgi:chemotaxis family two-component system sensor kinase Cph1